MKIILLCLLAFGCLCAYDPKMASNLAIISAATYENKSSLEDWSCYYCQKYTLTNVRCGFMEGDGGEQLPIRPERNRRLCSLRQCHRDRIQRHCWPSKRNSRHRPSFGSVPQLHPLHRPSRLLFGLSTARTLRARFGEDAEKLLRISKNFRHWVQPGRSFGRNGSYGPRQHLQQSWPAIYFRTAQNRQPSVRCQFHWHHKISLSRYSLRWSLGALPLFPLLSHWRGGLVWLKHENVPTLFCYLKKMCQFPLFSAMG